MPLNRLESLIEPLSEAEFVHTIMKRTQMAKYILDGNHADYPVHQLIDDVSIGKNDALFYVGYYIGNGNKLMPVILNNQSASFNMQDVLFKIIHIPHFPPYDLQLGHADKAQRQTVLNELQNNKLPYAMLALNASPDDLYFSRYSHRAEFSVSETLAEVQDSAMQQLAHQTGSLVSYPQWGDILL